MQPMFKQAMLIALVTVAANATAANPSDEARQPTAAPVQGSNADSTPDFGTNTFYTPLDGFAFQPGSSSATYFRGFSSGAYYCVGGTPDNRAIAQFNLPHGVRLTGFRTWVHDDQATAGVRVEFQRSCLPDFSAGFPITDTLSTSGTNAAFAGGDNSDFSSIGGTTLVDNQSCTYKILAEVGRTDAGAVSCPGGSTSLGVYKVRVQWNRFIPVAPGTATFTDVPVGTQFHREVEALVNTGITQGCTATTYCPTDPVNRLQMAAFLARALGLAVNPIADPANP